MRTVVVADGCTDAGKAISLKAAAAGWNVVAVVPPGTGATWLASEMSTNVHVREASENSAAGVVRAINTAAVEFGFLDALVNTSHHPHFGTLEWDGVTGAREVMERNYFRVLEATAAVLPHLRSTRGRVITVTDSGPDTTHFSESYRAAQAALSAYMDALTPVAAAVNIGVALVEASIEPGHLPEHLEKNVMRRAGAYRHFVADHMVGRTDRHRTLSLDDLAEVVTDLLNSKRMPASVRPLPSSWPDGKPMPHRLPPIRPSR
ncbi:SDR family NAD(P)-dependent oxidoreductase (plasmid) [Streptomyces sp. AHU1]|uniref:SDR family NAD(P)-dependent oxidoreductase n=1 Tax=Streptomyces sp. AHU1 TaxID=3377215 RepID=UPI003877DE57